MMSRAQEKAIKEFGPQRYNRVLAAAAMVARQDARFISAPTIRDEISQHAALAAIGVPQRSFVLSRHCGEINAKTESAAQEVFARALEAAKAAATKEKAVA